MTAGWPQNQQDLRWPYAENDDTGPAGPGRGRLATDTDSPAAGYPGFGENHPSGPLPVGPMRDPQQRGRLGRKSRGGRNEPGHEDAVAGDADYDWIKYLGEAGPAQESSRRPAGTARRSPDSADRTAAEPADSRGFTESPSPSGIAEERGRGRGAGRLLPRRHAAAAPAAEAPAAPSVAAPAPSTPAMRGPAAPPAAHRARSADSRTSRFADAADTNPAGRVAPPSDPAPGGLAGRPRRVRAVRPAGVTTCPVALGQRRNGRPRPGRVPTSSGPATDLGHTTPDPGTPARHGRRRRKHSRRGRRPVGRTGRRRGGPALSVKARMQHARPRLGWRRRPSSRVACTAGLLPATGRRTLRTARPPSAGRWTSIRGGLRLRPRRVRQPQRFVLHPSASLSCLSTIQT